MVRTRSPARRGYPPAALGLALALSACAVTTPPAESAPGDLRARRDHTEADARFMRDMVAHHEQALLMTALVPGRTERPDLRLLARRIEASQEEEIGRMRRWLEAREPSADMVHAMHGAHEMPGMATPAQLARLRAASGAAFDRLFLELMIHHHEGALAMVARLFETPGAAQEPELYRFATDIDGDQRAEIARMRRVLAGS